MPTSSLRIIVSHRSGLLAGALLVLTMLSMPLDSLAQAQERDTTVTSRSIQQATTADTTLTSAAPRQTLTDTPKRPMGFSLHVDYGKPAVSLLSEENKWELGGRFLFYERYYLTGEYGYGLLSPDNAIENGTYQSEGNYWRVGGGYMVPIGLKSRLGLGAMYARSTFTDEGRASIQSSLGNESIDFGSRQGEARWLEIVVTSEGYLRLNKERAQATINRMFSVGFFLRARFLGAYDRHEILDTYAVPGYGRTVNDPQFAANLFLRIHIY